MQVGRSFYGGMMTSSTLFSGKDRFLQQAERGAEGEQGEVQRKSKTTNAPNSCSETRVKLTNSYPETDVKLTNTCSQTDPVKNQRRYDN